METLPAIEPYRHLNKAVSSIFYPFIRKDNTIILARHYVV